MKHIKIYEDLIRDLQSLGITEHRCKIQVYKEFKYGVKNNTSFEVIKVYHVILPALTTEKEITKNVIWQELKEGRYELEIDQEVFKIPGIGEMQKTVLDNAIKDRWDKTINKYNHDTLRKALAWLVQFPTSPIWENKMVIYVDGEALVTY